MTTTAKTLDRVISTSDIAELAGVGRATVSNWKKRYDDFPKHVHEFSGNGVYDRAEIVRWLQENTKRRMENAKRTLKEAKENLAKSEQSLAEVQEAWDRVKRLRK